MELGELIQELSVLRHVLDDVLDYQGKKALDRARAQIEAQKKQKTSGRKKKKPKPWKLVIDPTAPIRFRECDIRGYKYQVDLFCTIFQPDSDIETQNESLTIRVWSCDMRLCHRQSHDSEEVGEKVVLQRRRVVQRFHFDRADPNQEGPRYHLQIGGVQQPKEYCWYLEELNLPRFIHHPVNLFLACEFVAANFFQEEYDDIAREKSWIGALRKAQKSFLAPYFDWINEWDRNRSLLKHLWNTA